MTSKRSERPFPTREEVLAFIRESKGPVGKREIARAFLIRGAERPALKELLKELRRSGDLQAGAKRRYLPAGELPPVMVLEITGIDPDGEVLAKPAVWRQEAAPPRIYVSPDLRKGAAGPGDRVLARLRRVAEGVYEASTMRVLAGVPKRIIGVYQRDAHDDHSGRGGRGGRLRPTDRRAKGEFSLDPEDAAGARPGELVLVEPKPSDRRLGARAVRVVERLGRIDETRALSLISIHEHDLPTVFPPAAMSEAAAGPAPAKGREDLRELPLVTIDGEDARDFDDAVWAEPDGDADNPGGWHLLVAIADVAHYVRPESALDKAAYERGNSAYFPDRVVPMLPEALSNGWCSLKPAEERSCLAVHLWVDSEGRMLRHRFLRGMMRSAARLTYGQTQAAFDGRPDEVAAPLLDGVIRPLFGAYQALARARSARGTLDLDLPERQVILGPDGQVAAIRPRERHDSHRLIEEFMIAANVAAAATLEEAHQPCMYRIHDAPDPQKLEALRQVLDGLGLRLARGQVIKPGLFRRILDQVRGRSHAAMVNELVLRSQSQAAYAPENLGHFGLALPRYAHFTSPIRRYADLLVHRALISGLGLGPGGLAKGTEATFAEQGRHISMTERRAQAAEREAVDRFTAAFLKARIGAIFTGRINGVTRFGLFVTLDDSGADGLIPISTLPEDYYDHLAAEHSLVGRRWGRRYSLGERVSTRLTEADPITGGMVLELIEEPSGSRETPAEAAGAAVAVAAEAAGWDPLSGGQSAPASGGAPKTGAKRRGKGAGAKPRRRRKARNENG